MAHFAVKRLTRSDLTFFEYQFRRQNAGNQKAINLNANVFIDDIFPYARTIAAGQAVQFPVRLQIYGPGLRANPDNKTRKVIAAGGSQKNWRLNGEFVPDPDDDPTRYHLLSEGDFAIFAFEESRIQPVPESIALLLVSKSEPDDAYVIGEIEKIIGTSRMIILPPDVLSAVSAGAAVDHPIRELLDLEMDAALEEAALGSADAIRKLRSKPSVRRMSAEALEKARANAENNGRDGEVLVNNYLKNKQDSGEITSFTWVSEENAISPWDFEIVGIDGTIFRIEVKSTSGGFERAIHISHNEILAATEIDAPKTMLYRIFALSKEGGWLRISPSISDTCRHIIDSISSLRPGITPDSYSINVDTIADWSAAERLTYDELE